MSRHYVAIAIVCVAALGATGLFMNARAGRSAPAQPAPAQPAPAQPAPAQATPGQAARASDQKADNGTYGFSHESSSLIGGKMVMTMKEGPDGPQFRCQTEALPCSYLELKALSGSGAAIPPELHMTGEELRKLVSELDTVSTHLARYKNNVNQACRDGYPDAKSSQVGNMGIHMSNPSYMEDGIFDLTKPEILLFATPTPGADQLTQQQIGDCVNGTWTGDAHQQIVGAAYIQFSEAHPGGFAGPIDNWHVHYNLCIGTLSAATLSAEECRKRGGAFLPSTGWMIHTYVVPEFDNQLGVFAQWNPSIWPKTEAKKLATSKTHNMQAMEQMFGGAGMAGHDMSTMPGHDMSGHDMSGHGGMPEKENVIFEFRFAPVEVKAGQTVVFRNADPVYHTVTSGTPGAPTATFDSGRLFADQTFKVTLDKPGTYTYFCRLHENMVGTIVVK